MISSFIGDHLKDIAHATTKAATPAGRIFFPTQYVCPYWQGIAVLYRRSHDDRLIIVYYSVPVLSFFITIIILYWYCTNWYAFQWLSSYCNVLWAVCWKSFVQDHSLKDCLSFWDVEISGAKFKKLPGCIHCCILAFPHNMHLLSLVQAPLLQLLIVQLLRQCLQGASDQGNCGIKPQGWPLATHVI